MAFGLTVTWHISGCLGCTTLSDDGRPMLSDARAGTLQKQTKKPRLQCQQRGTPGSLCALQTARTHAEAPKGDVGSGKAASRVIELDAAAGGAVLERKRVQADDIVHIHQLRWHLWRLRLMRRLLRKLAGLLSLLDTAGAGTAVVRGPARARVRCRRAQHGHMAWGLAARVTAVQGIVAFRATGCGAACPVRARQHGEWRTCRERVSAPCPQGQ